MPFQTQAQQAQRVRRVRPARPARPAQPAQPDQRALQAKEVNKLFSQFFRENGTKSSILERMKSAAAIVKALSRPTSQKSGAWSTKDPEKGGKTAEEVAKEKEMKMQKKKNQLEALLEEELDEDKGKGPEPIGNVQF